MGSNKKKGSKNGIDKSQLDKLTRQQLKELEEKEKTRGQIILDWVIMILPVVCGIVAIGEYLWVPDNSPNKNPNTYLGMLVIFIAAFLIYFIVALVKKLRGDKTVLDMLRYRAPLFSALFLLLAGYDYLTLKTGILTQPFVPCMNYIINIAWTDRAYLIECTLHTLRLLFLGYFIGVALGLVTGITCGYSEKVRYWVNPVIKFLGPIPTSTWIPIVMVVATSLFKGAVFIIALGSWFAVTVASMTGISNVDKDFFEAARTLGASSRQLVFRVAIPHAMPSILQGCTQAMSSACVAIMIAEMMGVKAGLGWYMNWAKSWAAYDKMFAALFVICFIFTIVTKALDLVKRRVLRWQNGVVK
ncbi:ABC transporter permease [Bariatricus sp. SGI.154]|uniref:ABC transporter permease n=1 Tax=Bariatricus sp. SGI.154 TaxID=3420549 RepID=UPI003D02D339